MNLEQNFSEAECGDKDKNSGIDFASEELTLAKPHPILAAIIDMYILEMILSSLAAFIKGIFKISFIDTIFLVLGCIFLVLIIIYHASICKKVIWLSLGEIISGKTIFENKKEWVNLYGINRIGVFIVVIIALLSFRNSDILAGAELSLGASIGFGIRTIVVFIGILQIGKGKLNGIVILNILLLLKCTFSLVFGNSKIVIFNGYYSLVMFIVFIIIGFIYKTKRTIYPSVSK